VIETPVMAPTHEVVNERVSEPDSGPKSVRIKTERVRPGSHRKNGGSSSMIRGFMIVGVVAVVGFVVWWAMTTRSVEPTRPRVEPPERAVVAAQTVELEEPAGSVDSAITQTTGLSESTVVVDDTQETPPGEGVETSRDLDGLLAAPVESAPALAAQIPEEPAATVDPFEAAMRHQSKSGWALHWFSFPDSMEAVVEGRKLQREGYAVAVRGANVKGRRWYRVLVGDFDTRAAASKFQAQAREKFGVDWVGVAKK
jgi:cell division septation protein DedD